MEKFKNVYVDASTPEKLKEVVDFLLSVGQTVANMTTVRATKGLINGHLSIRFDDYEWIGSGIAPNSTLKDLKALFDTPDSSNEESSKTKLNEGKFFDNSTPEERNAIIGLTDWYKEKSEKVKVWVSDDENATKENWYQYYFITDLGSQFNSRFICVIKDDEEEYLNGENDIHFSSWRFMLTEAQYQTKFIYSRLVEIDKQIEELTTEREKILKRK